jgi:hypothetical protein
VGRKRVGESEGEGRREVGGKERVKGGAARREGENEWYGGEVGEREEGS